MTEYVSNWDCWECAIMVMGFVGGGLTSCLLVSDKFRKVLGVWAIVIAGFLTGIAGLILLIVD